MSEHEAQHEALEREAADLEDQTDRLGDHIDHAREDWERKKADPSVPGAAGDPQAAESGQQPETAYAGKGSSEETSGDVEGEHEDHSGEVAGNQDGLVEPRETEESA